MQNALILLFGFSWAISLNWKISDRTWKHQKPFGLFNKGERGRKCLLFGAAVLHNYNRRTYYNGVLERACGNDDDDDDAFCFPNHFFPPFFKEEAAYNKPIL